MHDRIIAIFPLHVNFELLDALLVGHFHHLLVDEFSTGVKLPIPIFVTHGITHCGKNHAGFVPVDHCIGAFINLNFFVDFCFYLFIYYRNQCIFMQNRFRMGYDWVIFFVYRITFGTILFR